MKQQQKSILGKLQLGHPEFNLRLLYFKNKYSVTLMPYLGTIVHPYCIFFR